ncbi:hypothetical protein MPTK1_1g28510 [Marchantia polymorpha subsp. ruderalis]|uniref:DOG1 domain-containing protein n=2 Tax=Marchantia polymorpha TaxID=3197 RepID=A0AAF6AV88_MARPO|nr:hypothetical protein MARPO_0002s0029 [Marchantia polymorpha]BBN00359.1 hypothetical protein Mp_1g28510 [Marchantia polymorpha subsp. ruderalis]|eukprot:PTQ49524.1 hypothetical protein MARPO_0002s0029 [Marchantia polymorpha]
MGSLSGPNNEPYVDFHSKWKEEQEQLTDELRSALDADLGEMQLRELVRKVETHYEEYYAAKDDAVRQNVLTVMQPAWKSPLENVFMWIGGWRPTMVFQLAYAQAGQQMEAELAEFLQDLDTPSMASLSAKQLQRISDLQVVTQKAEDELGHRQAILQQGLVDQPLLTLAAVELSGDASAEQHPAEHALTDAVDEKVKGLEDLCHDADRLRCDTLKKMLKILTPVQAAQYLVAAAQLQMAIRRIGVAKQGAAEQHKNGDELEHKNGETETHTKETKQSSL